MRRVFRPSFIGRSLTVIAAITLSVQMLAAGMEPRGPSLGERLRGFIHRVVSAFSDNLIIPPG
jgi:hypothetical protein